VSGARYRTALCVEKNDGSYGAFADKRFYFHFRHSPFPFNSAISLRPLVWFFFHNARPSSRRAALMIPTCVFRSARSFNSGCASCRLDDVGQVIAHSGDHLEGLQQAARAHRCRARGLAPILGVARVSSVSSASFSTHPHQPLGPRSPFRGPRHCISSLIGSVA